MSEDPNKSPCCVNKKAEVESTQTSCHSDKIENSQTTSSCCDTPTEKIDWFLWSCLAITSIFYALAFASLNHDAWYGVISHSVHELINTMWWSVVLAIFFVGILGRIPQEFIMSILGKGGTVKGLWRATLAGVMLDLCSHGILMVGMELRRKGASLGQVMAFLIASPWNSISLTLIMIALIGWEWTLSFIVLSMLIALIAGWLFDRFEQNGTLPANPVISEIPDGFKFWQEAKKRWSTIVWNRALASGIAKEGFTGSKMVIRWLLFGVLLASAIRGFVSLDDFQSYFGPSLIGLAATLLAATIIEVCSEGSTPIAADLMTRANAPGNSFAFLMTGVATDYTEVMVIKDSMKSWKIALFLPLLTVPQVIVVAIILNGV
ncbi:MAG: uncharacterized membrane protein YraQ (UPF0718 family) [Oleiphilaceae bacterium]|jgi:uncharacterized membrane protein YraQ (UPF0718 family)